MRRWQGHPGLPHSVSTHYFTLRLWAHCLTTTEDNVLTEARNLRNMTIQQTPLLGEENTPLHIGPGGGTGFESATPRHQVAFTPNPLATPRDTEQSGDVAATPRTVRAGISATPLRTPMRDNLSINPADQTTFVGDTPREQKLRESSAKRALKAGFLNLPKPENNFELLVPDDEDGDGDVDGQTPMSEEDAAERDARLQRIREENERKALARRSQAVQRNLPRPANVDMAQLMNDLSIGEDDDLPADTMQLINEELVNILQHDSIAHPLPGSSKPGSTKSAYHMPADGDIDAARVTIHLELATMVGFPNANPDQLKEGLAALAKTEGVDESASWARVRQQLVFDAAQNKWTEPASLTPEQRIDGYTVLLNQCREKMAKEAAKSAKLEKKLGVTLGGYQARAKTLAKRVTDAFEEFQKVKVDYESFSRLKVNESAVGPRRVEALKEEVERLERRERSLQAQYAQLESERQEAEARVSALEDKVMADAEALNEAVLAEMDAVDG